MSEVFLGIPIQILVTFIALVCIPTMLQSASRTSSRTVSLTDSTSFFVIYAVQAVLTVISFWIIYAFMASMFRLRQFLHASKLERISQGIDALFEQTEAEVDIFRDRITFLFPTSPTTCSKQTRNNIASRRECAKKIKDMCKPNVVLKESDVATLDLAHGLLLAA